MSCSLICFSRKPVGLEVSTFNLQPYRYRTVTCRVKLYIYTHIYIYISISTTRKNIACDSFAERSLSAKTQSSKNLHQKFVLHLLRIRNNLFSQLDKTCQLSIPSDEKKFWTCQIGSTPFFLTEQRGKYDPAQPSPHSSDLYFLNLLWKIVPIDSDSTSAFSDQFCHVKSAGLVSDIVANRNSCKPDLQLTSHLMDWKCSN